MHRICILCLSLLLVASVGNAQLFSSKTWLGDTGKINLRINALGLMDLPDGNISVGGEYRFNRTWAVLMDAGYIAYSTYYFGTTKTSGVLLRPGVRLYGGKLRSVFLDLQFHYKGVQYHVDDWLDKDVVNNVPTYQERRIFLAQKRVYGGQFVVGGKEFLDPDYRWFLEFYVGVGLRYKEEWLRGVPDARYDGGTAFFRSGALTEHKYSVVVPAFPAFIRLVHTIR
ncbi:hypothetical protein A4D02_20810 [Niastella koreensis]|uniref:DUF3575 domain-containing protein n=2 Tax=Niastella koreensis TaxID=354356 RepID=G8TLP1_NIAKG|nr:DUF3575 domain-containing protein [Niastella koreensis]AEV96610.1 hypothetical protein Niako_0210 [Niastella koreensis GR20-10]OQP54122.1 hypothetical protein A4D02_20810 [Niastella koreensis]